MKTCTHFRPEAFPGYAHRRTIGDEHAGAGGPNAEIGAASKTYAFVPRGAANAPEKPSKGKKGDGAKGGGKGPPRPTKKGGGADGNRRPQRM